MKRAFGVVREGVRALLHFARIYPWTCAYAAAVYAGFGAVAKYYVVLPLDHYTPLQLAGWLVTVPQTLALAPVWTALPRFIILDDEVRRLPTFDVRLRRVVLVSIVLSAVLMLGGLASAIAIDALRRFPIRLSFARLILMLMNVPRLAVWWLLLRLAIAPAMAAAGARAYPLDTAFSFTRGWLGRIFGVRLIVYAPLALLIGGLTLAARTLPDVQNLFNQPLWIAVTTLVTALTELVDAAAMARIAMRIVRVRQGEREP
jgi:hypothetical protein